MLTLNVISTRPILKTIKQLSYMLAIGSISKLSKHENQERLYSFFSEAKVVHMQLPDL
jgi:hypothetical protein